MAFQAGRREPASQCSHSNCHSGLSAVGDGPQGQPGACSSCHSCSWLDDCSQGFPCCRWQSTSGMFFLSASRLVPFDKIKTKRFQGFQPAPGSKGARGKGDLGVLAHPKGMPWPESGTHASLLIKQINRNPAWAALRPVCVCARVHQ